MSFAPPGPGQARQPGAEFVRSAPAGGVFARGQDGGTVLRDPAPVGMLGEGQIGRSAVIARQTAERVFKGAPRFWRVTNRAEKGHVEVWMGAFNGEVYPEGATDDKSTWLKPGESMLIPIEAGLHLFGNVFDRRLPDARDVIERMGGLELETEEKQPGKNAMVRVVGGPIGLPDMLIEPIDGRLRPVGEPIPLYDLYWTKLRKEGVLHRRSVKDPAQREVEAEQLLQRIGEYKLEGGPIYEDDVTLYDGSGRPVRSEQLGAPIQMDSAVDDDELPPDDESVPDMRTAAPPEDDPPKA